MDYSSNDVHYVFTDVFTTGQSVRDYCDVYFTSTWTDPFFTIAFKKGWKRGTKGRIDCECWSRKYGSLPENILQRFYMDN